MKLQEVIRIFEDKRQNNLPVSEKARIIDSFERRLNNSLLKPLGKGIAVPDSRETEDILSRDAVIGDGFEEVYYAYLCAECSLAEGNIPRYNTDIEEYTRLFREYSQYLTRDNSIQFHRLYV